ncbi:MAG: anaerobic glycerol-3-phosphate dehydrogenase subunit B [Deferribacteraceae bacterium]|jgi:glycerol-3-phosphate dehydrogenase subunit B|nr:anaerobic glycerol-3-phosphate dehydrogenase subunit B [Deferribacteraceae bacterium]
MKSEADLLVVGGGFAGLIAALAAAENNKKTVLITFGAGSLAVGGGVVDLLGADEANRLVIRPFEHIEKMPKEHPYSLLGVRKVRGALSFFERITKDYGYPYISDGVKNSFMVTPIGKLKPTYMFYEKQHSVVLKESQDIIILGVNGLKDFFPDLLLNGFARQPLFKNKNFKVINLPSPFHKDWDLTSFEIAAFVTRDEGREWFKQTFKKNVPKSTVVIAPPILGIEPEDSVRLELAQSHGAAIIESATLPPSVLGIRLRKLLIDLLKAKGVAIIEAAKIVSSEVKAKKCLALFTSDNDRLRRYSAKEYIIATGGFFGGGAVALPGRAYEAVFNIDFDVPKVQEEWSEKKLFGVRHPFGAFGVKVDSSLRAIDSSGEPILENVRFAGRILGGYDFAAEKSGNGVALVSAYNAARG